MKEEFTEELVRRARDGDMAAKEKLCQQFKDSIYRMAHTPYKTLDAEDVAQELWLCFFEELAKYDFKAGVPFSAYIRTRLKWRAVGCCRIHEKKLSAERTADGIPDSRGNDGMNDMNEEDLHEFISRFPLTEMQKTMLEKRLSGMTWEEIAAERKVSRCGIYGYMRRIRKIFMASRDFKEIFAA